MATPLIDLAGTVEARCLEVRTQKSWSTVDDLGSRAM
jgi:hypothetical protein